MRNDPAARLDRLVARLPAAYAGPGGAVAVLRRGEVLVRHAWGYANAERRIPFTPRTLFRVCSITKQFACAALLSACRDPEILAPALRARLPQLDSVLPTIAQLCHNQSGLRDYWAVAMLLGALAEDGFADAEAARTIGATRTTHFAPGARYSYCNQNFRLISDLLEAHAGQGFATLLRHHVFDPAGMETAFLAADTRAMPDGAEGYEGTVAAGFRPAVNRILWTGDAGMGASLDDLIAWERWIDATRDDPGALYARLSAPVAFADGTQAAYGFGLDRPREFGHAMTAHSGALRGWRSHRLHLAAERISVVVLFNHMADPQAAAHEILACLLERVKPAADPSLPVPAWIGAHVEPETGLLARIEAGPPGELRLRFSAGPDRLLLTPDGAARNARVALLPDGDALRLVRTGENLDTRLVPLAAAASDGRRAVAELAGRYRCEELDAELTIADAGGVAHGVWSGPLGAGRMEQMEPIGADLWVLPCARALDVAPPGDWTLAVRRDDAGRVAGLRVGCWLARGLDYDRRD
jgi:D-aminopeptidase